MPSNVQSLVFRSCLIACLGSALALGSGETNLGQDTAARSSLATAGEDESQKLIERLRLGLRQCETVLQQTEQQVSTMNQRLKELRDQLESLQPPEPAQRPPSLPPPTEKNVRYRPPMERYIEPDDQICAVCASGRVAVVDFKPVSQRNREVTKQLLEELLKTKQSVSKDVVVDLGKGFRMEGSVKITDVKIEGNQIRYKLKAAYRLKCEAGHGGESSADLSGGKSRFHQSLDSHNAKTCVVSFFVWPDSHQSFREARDIAWSKGYSLGWDPQEAGKPSREFGFGSGTDVQ